MKRFLPLLFISTAINTQACDICGNYTAPSPGTYDYGYGVQLSIAGQFTHMGSLRLDGHEVPNPGDQFLNSSNTQLVVARRFLDDRLLLQANFPLIYRDYRRPEGGDIEDGTESGLGDISLLAGYQVFNYESSAAASPAQSAKDAKSTLPAATRDVSVFVNVFAGIKLPTGDSGALDEESHEDHDHEHDDGPESGIHGHDLALGSGSVDALVGGDLFARSGDWFFQGDLQYAIRSEGDYSYQYANDLTWSCGPGWYALRESDRSFALQLRVSGETKNSDQSHGESEEGTAFTAVYMGPQFLASSGAFAAELGLDIPVMLDNDDLQIAPDYRIRAAVTWRF